MKKTSLILAAAFAVALAASCNKVAEAPEFTTYTLTVDATRDAASTRALSLSGKTLNAVWTSSDEVIVLKGTSKIGTLTPQSTGSASAVLKGSVTGSVSAGDNLTLITPRNTWNYTNQDGTLATLSSDYAYATAPITVSAVSGSSISASAASFTNRQAIVKFSLVNSEGAPLKASELIISASSGKLVKQYKVSSGAFAAVNGDIDVVPTSATSEFYVALASENAGSDTYTLTATVGSSQYNCTHSATFEAGKYYAGTVNMEEETHTYTVAGSPASVFGTEWAPTNTDNDMVKQADGTYAKTYNLTAVKTNISFKVALDHSWDTSWPAVNYVCTAGAGAFTVTFDPSTTTVTATYNDPPADATDTYTVAGTPASVFGTEWSATNTANDMTKQADGTYAITYSSVPAGTALEFKVTVNHGWASNWGADGVHDGANVKHTMSATKDLKISFNPTTHIISATEI